jgi:L-alanine-DL-glutamate epimerase-like enolase superfamily enzyme
MVLATIRAGGSEGLGWTYAGACCKAVVEDELNGVLYGGDPMDIPGLWGGMVRACRNLGRPGLGHADRWFLQRDGDRLPATQRTQTTHS